MERVLTPAEQAAAKRAEELEWRSHWRHTFLRSGGFLHVLNIVTGRAVVEDSWTAGTKYVDDASITLRKSCLAVAVKIVRFFVLGAMVAKAPTMHGTGLLRQRSFTTEHVSSDSEMDLGAAAAAVKAAARRLSVSENDLAPAGASWASAPSDVPPPPPTDFNVLVRQLSESSVLSDVILKHVDFRALQVPVSCVCVCCCWGGGGRGHF